MPPKRPQIIGKKGWNELKVCPSDTHLRTSTVFYLIGNNFWDFFSHNIILYIFLHKSIFYTNSARGVNCVFEEKDTENQTFIPCELILPILLGKLIGFFRSSDHLRMIRSTLAIRISRKVPRFSGVRNVSMHQWIKLESHLYRRVFCSKRRRMSFLARTPYLRPDVYLPDDQHKTCHFEWTK